MAIQNSVRSCRWSLALGSSIVAMGIASSAQAQCSPDPTVFNGTTTCVGTDADGLLVDTFATRVIVADGSTVRAGARDAAIITRERLPSLDIRGTIDGGSKPGLLISTGSFMISSSIFTTINVAVQGQVTGAQGIAI